jgi:hypothetical protein
MRIVRKFERSPILAKRIPLPYQAARKPLTSCLCLCFASLCFARPRRRMPTPRWDLGYFEDSAYRTILDRNPYSASPRARIYSSLNQHHFLAYHSILWIFHRDLLLSGYWKTQLELSLRWVVRSGQASRALRVLIPVQTPVHIHFSSMLREYARCYGSTVLSRANPAYRSQNAGKTPIRRASGLARW